MSEQAPSEPRRILLFSSEPTNSARLQLDREVREIRQALKSSRLREEFDVEDRSAVRSGDLQGEILGVRPEFVHFCGHGTGEGGLALEDERGEVKLVSTEALADLFRSVAEHVGCVRCVVLNACYSEVQADQIVNHVDYVVGMSQEIGDDAAVDFARGFYGALFEGLPVGAAFDFGRNAIQLESLPGSLVNEESRHLSPGGKPVDILPEHLKPVLKKRPGLVEAEPPSEPVMGWIPAWEWRQAPYWGAGLAVAAVILVVVIVMFRPPSNAVNPCLDSPTDPALAADTAVIGGLAPGREETLELADLRLPAGATRGPTKEPPDDVPGRVALRVENKTGRRIRLWVHPYITEPIWIYKSFCDATPVNWEIPTGWVYLKIEDLDARKPFRDLMTKRPYDYKWVYMTASRARHKLTIRTLDPQADRENIIEYEPTARSENISG